MKKFISIEAFKANKLREKQMSALKGGGPTTGHPGTAGAPPGPTDDDWNGPTPPTTGGGHAGAPPAPVDPR
ncbi:hypothetical protein DMA11_05045 [Marinilabiliaceae bacterium JC017]|nr:hypothetical protein DMA11_05045 [Marinilabiliaceae bacterium JC017]